MGNTNEGIQGEYKYVGKDSNNNDYWTMPQGTDCWAGDFVTDFYIRYSTTWDRWEISYANQESCYFYECRPRDGTKALLPWNCGHNDWFGGSGYKQDFYVINGECPPSQPEQYLDVTEPDDSDYYWKSCYGNFIAVDGKKNLYKLTEIYDYGWEGGKYQSYWLYSIYLQSWVCDVYGFSVAQWQDYATGCYNWHKPEKDLEFHDQN